MKNTFNYVNSNNNSFIFITKKVQIPIIIIIIIKDRLYGNSAEYLLLFKMIFHK